MKPEHQLFIHHYILTGDKYAAYKAVYPHAEGQALQAAARRLINKPHIRQYLEVQLFSVRDSIAEQQLHVLPQDEQATLIMKRQALHHMISGEYKTRKYYKVRDHLEEVDEALSPFALLRAIELDTKLANEWYNRNNKPASQPATVEVVEQSQQAKAKIIPLPPVAHEQWCENQYGPDFMPAIRAQMVRDNPRKAEEYTQQGLRVLDYCPSSQEIYRMMSNEPLSETSATPSRTVTNCNQT